MATTRDSLNKVLRGLRQFGLIIPSGTTSVTDDYLLMLLQFINEAKEEIEESGWCWQSLRTTITLSVVAGQVEYNLLAASEADIDTTDRSRLLYENVTSVGRSEGFFDSTSSKPMVFDVTDATEHRLTERTQEYIERKHFVDNDETQAVLQDFSIYSDADNMRIKLHPTPSEARTVKIRMYNPTTELVSTDLDTVLSIPFRPIWTLALMKANQERGDELGKEGSVLHIAYLNAHGAAVAREQSPGDITVGLDR
jgi:hypothetical protein